MPYRKARSVCVRALSCKGGGLRARHTPHGSVNRQLLVRREERFLCLQCHVDPFAANVPHSRLSFQTRGDCTRCHSAIHGSNFDASFLHEDDDATTYLTQHCSGWHFRDGADGGGAGNSNGFTSEGSITFGYRFVDVRGYRPKFEELLNLKSGARLQDFSLLQGEE